MKSLLDSTRSILAAASTVAAALSPLVAVGAAEAPHREDTILVSMEAVVAAIDHETREVTLEDSYGKQVMIKAGERVERLDEVEVGDIVEADYYLSVAFEIRQPTSDEQENPLQFLEEVDRAGPEHAPTGAGLRIITAVCTIEGLDRPTETVTLRGPLGGLNLVKVRDVNNLPLMRIGDSVVVTFTEALAIGIEKVAQN